MWEPNPHSPRLTGSRGGLLTLVKRYTAATTPNWAILFLPFSVRPILL